MKIQRTTFIFKVIRHDEIQLEQFLNGRKQKISTKTWIMRYDLEQVVFGNMVIWFQFTEIKEKFSIVEMKLEDTSGTLFH